MVTARIGVRVGEVLNKAWEVSISRRAPLAGDTNRIRAGEDKRDLSRLVAMRNSCPTRISPELYTELDKIEWVDIGRGKRIMKGEVTLGLFEQVMRGYAITGPDSHLLRIDLHNPSRAGHPLVYVNLREGREFVRRLNDLIGREGEEFEIPTKVELQVNRDELVGDNWVWTETKGTHNEDHYMIHSLQDGLWCDRHPEDRSYTLGLRVLLKRNKELDLF